MKPTQAQSFIYYASLVVKQLPTNKHSTENVNLVKSLRNGFGLATGLERPDVFLHFWSREGESESIEVCFRDRSIVKFLEGRIMTFEVVL